MGSCAVRLRFDRFDKEVITGALAGTGAIETQVEVSAEVQYADVVFVPDPDQHDERGRRGLLGRMAFEACLFEPFSEPPGVHEVLECVRKQLTLHHAASVEAKRQRSEPPGPQRPLWITSSGRPARVLEALGFAPRLRWPVGVYGAALGWRVNLVVASELPRDRETLLVRLLGRGRTFREAVEDLKALPEDAWERRIAVPPLIRLRLTIAGDPELRFDEEQELAMTMTDDLLEQYERKLREEGRHLGLQEGRQEGQLEGRQQGLRLAAREVFEVRFGEMPPELRGALERCTDVSTLVRITTAAGTERREDVERLLRTAAR